MLPAVRFADNPRNPHLETVFSLLTVRMVPKIIDLCLIKT